MINDQNQWLHLPSQIFLGVGKGISGMLCLNLEVNIYLYFPFLFGITTIFDTHLGHYTSLMNPIESSMRLLHLLSLVVQLPSFLVFHKLACPLGRCQCCGMRPPR